MAVSTDYIYYCFLTFCTVMKVVSKYDDIMESGVNFLKMFTVSFVDDLYRKVKRL